MTNRNVVIIMNVKQYGNYAITAYKEQRKVTNFYAFWSRLLVCMFPELYPGNGETQGKMYANIVSN